MGAEARIEEFETGTPTAVDAARAAGCKLGQIVKTLVFDGEGRWVVALVPETDKIWMNGELVDWADATVHDGTHGLHYGTGVFEGIRCYETDKGPAVFWLTDHLKRFDNSAKLLYMELGYSVEELHSACM